MERVIGVRRPYEPPAEPRERWPAPVLVVAAVVLVAVGCGGAGLAAWSRAALDGPVVPVNPAPAPR
jgi:hypothetical protein